MLRETHGHVAIVAATVAALDAEDRDVEELAAMLGVVPPPSWPPEHNDADSRAWFRAKLLDYPEQPGCAAWYIVVAGRLCGTCGFKGPPDAAGGVEIGYAVIPEEQRRGHAAAAVGLLVERAFRDPGVTAVIAKLCLR